MGDVRCDQCGVEYSVMHVCMGSIPSRVDRLEERCACLPRAVKRLAIIVGMSDVEIADLIEES